MCLLAALLVGCGSREPETTLKVLAGSELQDMGPVLREMQTATGVRLQIDYAGSLDGAERLAGGEKADLAWFSHGNISACWRGRGSPRRSASCCRQWCWACGKVRRGRGAGSIIPT
ncbi:MAG: hypothetical protein HC889_02985 [Synechococcaceae cyanobacterium SM1_2_3]|nr:hypothetical protein [Synechococcaceae cyanobacterium SM1_2_3]